MNVDLFLALPSFLLLWIAVFYFYHNFINSIDISFLLRKKVEFQSCVGEFHTLFYHFLCTFPVPGEHICRLNA